MGCDSNTRPSDTRSPHGAVTYPLGGATYNYRCDTMGRLGGMTQPGGSPLRRNRRPPPPARSGV